MGKTYLQIAPEASLQNRGTSSKSLSPRSGRGKTFGTDFIGTDGGRVPISISGCMLFQGFQRRLGVTRARCCTTGGSTTRPRALSSVTAFGSPALKKSSPSLKRARIRWRLIMDHMIARSMRRPNTKTKMTPKTIAAPVPCEGSAREGESIPTVALASGGDAIPVMTVAEG